MERQPSISGSIKEGFLLKKGISRWKTRWFVLFEDRLNYCRKRETTCAVGSIHLKGAALVFPVPGYEKKKAVFLISTHDGKDMLLRAPTENDRDLWTHAVGAVIRSLDSSFQDPPKEDGMPICGRVNLSDLLGAMQDPDAGIQLQTCQLEDITYDHCFPGNSAVDWLLRWAFVTTREQGVHLASKLVHLAHIQPLNIVTASGNKEKFVDDIAVFYRFSALNRCNSQEMLFDSSSGSSNSSLGEASEGDFLSSGKHKNRGRVIKEGFLSKRGHLRKKWKVRKVVLKENPPCLEYYATDQEINEPLKVLQLKNSLVLDINIDTKDDELLTAIPKKRKHVFCVKRDDHRPIVLQADDEHQKVEWIRAIQKVCQ